MYRLIVSAFAFFGLCTATLAADFTTSPLSPPPPSNEAPPRTAPETQPAFTWAGLHAGVYAGASLGGTKVRPFSSTLPPQFMRPRGVTFGGLAGFDVQRGPLVAGVEGEFGRDTANKAYLATNNANTDTFSRERFIGRARVRAGFAILPQMLLYGAGGRSWGDQSVRLYSQTTNPDRLSINHQNAGWNFGAGLDYAVTRTVIVRAEYIRDDFGHQQKYQFHAGSSYADRDVSLQKNTLRTAVMAKF
jgi:outer membrane immunogenic protein